MDLGIGDEAGAAGSYAEVVELIRAKQAEGDAAEPEPEPLVVANKTVYKLDVPKDPKNPKKGRKQIDVETTSVNAKARTCTLKDCDTKKPLVDEKTKKPKNFSWNELIVG